jgi:CRP-like cAMP-binding protein
MGTSRVLTRELAELRPGDHVLVIYEDPVDLITFVVPFLQQGLARGEQVLYVVNDLRLSQVTEALAAEGVDVAREIERGALVFLNAQEYYSSPRVDASHLVELNRGRVSDARARHFAGLRLAAEMTWALKMGVPEDALVEYESLLDDAYKGLGPLLTAACMYRRGRFTPAHLARLLRSHAKVVAGDHVLVSLNPLFQNLAEPDLHALLQSASERRIPTGSFFYNQGDEASEIFLLTNGKVKLVRTDPDGRSVIFGLMVQTELIGQADVLAKRPRLWSAQALEDSRALVWDVETMLQAMMRHPTIGLNLAQLMSQRIEEILTRVEDLSLLRVEQRFARLLLRLARTLGRPTPQGTVLEVPLSGQDLAEMAGTTQYTVSRLLADWRRLDIVDAQRDRILILQPLRLAAIAGEADRAEAADPAEGGAPPV